MSRKPRIWYPGATYHITSRGNRQAALFYDTADRLQYLSLFAEARRQFPCILHTYCLMTNHIHLQFETIEHPPGNIMKFLNFRYAKYFNKRYSYSGHLFQGRYGAEVIKSIDYFLTVSRYIHLNPVKAGIVPKPELYKWSSYPAYISSSKSPYIDTTRLLSYFPPPSKQKYKQYVESIKGNPEEWTPSKK